MGTERNDFDDEELVYIPNEFEWLRTLWNAQKLSGVREVDCTADVCLANGCTVK